MKKLIIIAILCLAGQQAFAQIKMQGVVKDSTGTALELANVIAINKETKKLESYGITNDKGKYMLSLGKNATYDVKVSYIGLKTFEAEITTQEANITKDFTLKPDNALDEVQLTYEMPVTIKGDTIVYNADSFKNGTERKLEDVLEKLPGVEINEDGQVEVEGQVVQKVMVDGKDFFDGDTKLATKNIPSNAVDKVQVLKNYAEVGQLRGVTNNSDNVALNIKLKEGKTNFWFGDVTAGGGFSPDNELYLAQPKLFYYSPKYSLNFIGDLNNTGEVVITGRDLFNFTGGFRAPSRSSGTNLNLGSNSLGFLANQNRRALDIQTKFGAGNFSYSPNESLDWSGFVIFNSSRVRTLENSSIVYTDANLGIPNEFTSDRSTQRSDIGIAKLSASYQPNVNNQMDYDVLARVSKETQDQTLISNIVGTTGRIEENTPYRINQNLNYYYTLNENNIFALEAQHLIQDEDPFYNGILENDPTNNDNPNNPNDDLDDPDAFDSTAEALGFNRDQFFYNLNQERQIESNQLDAKLDYWNVLNAKSNINFTLGTIYSRQIFNSNLFQLLDNESVFEPTPTVNDGLDFNSTDYRFSDVYLASRYTLKAGKFTFRPAVSFHAYGNKNFQFGEEFGEDFFRVLPDLDIRWDIKNSQSLTFRYNMQNQFTDVTNLARGIVLNNFNSVFIGNPELENGLSQNLSLFFRSFNLYNFTNIIGSISYSSRVDQIRNIVNFESVIRNSTVFNSAFADETVTAFGRFQKTIKKFTGTIQTRFNYSKFNQFVQDRRSVNESFSQNYSFRLRTNFREAPNVSIRYDYNVQDNEQGATTTKFITRSPSIDFDAYIWKSVTFKTDYSYTEQVNGNNANSFQNWNASLAYRKDRDAKWEYEIRATNLLDIESEVTNGSSNISVNGTEFFIQPRFVTFRLRYTL